MRYILFFLVCLFAPLQAQQIEGTFVLEGYGMKEVLVFGPDSVSTLISGDGMSPDGYTENSPVAEWATKAVVLGPRADRLSPYESIQVLEVDENGLMLGRSSRQFDSVEEALAEDPVPGKFYFKESRYLELQQYPTLPEPDEAAFLALLQEAYDRNRGRPIQGGEEDALFARMLADKGYNPFTSKDVFIAARHKHQYSAPVEELLKKFEDLSH